MAEPNPTDLIPTGDPNNVDIPKPEEIQRIQEIFEEMIRRFKETGQRVDHPLEKIGDVDQGYFTCLWLDRVPPIPPESGVVATKADGSRIQYSIHFFHGRLEDHNGLEILVGQNNMVVRESGGKVYAGADSFMAANPFFEAPVLRLGDMYDDIIIQATANVYDVPIANRRHVNFLDREAVARMNARGYEKRPGTWNEMIKFFEPQAAKS